MIQTKSNKIKSAEDWIKAVKGNRASQYLNEHPISYSSLTQYMEWYGSYIANKIVDSNLNIVYAVQGKIR